MDSLLAISFELLIETIYRRLIYLFRWWVYSLRKLLFDLVNMDFNTLRTMDICSSMLLFSSATLPTEFSIKFIKVYAIKKFLDYVPNSY